MDAPLFSVIVLSYRSGDFLYTALDSVLAQDYPNVELLVADDGTPDFDRAAVEAYLQANAGANIRHYAVLTSAENQGTVRNFNRALEEARGVYLKGIGADDALYDAHVLTQVSQMFRETGACLLAARVMKCDPALQPVEPLRDKFLRSLPELSPEEVWKRLCVHNDLPAAGMFYTRDFFETYGYYDQHCRLLEDWPAWLRATRQGCQIAFGDFWGAKYRADTGFATGIHPDYLKDKSYTFETEIRPYRRRLGMGRYLLSLGNMRLRDSLTVRKLYGMLFRR